MTGPDPNKVYPNENIRQVVFIKNVVKRANIVVGDYTYYDDPDGAEKFEEHVTHHYDFLGDRLVIGKFCAIARGIEFVMNGANHRMRSVTTYPFNIMGGGWEKFSPKLKDLPFKGDTVVGNDVWIGQNVTVMPGVHIGDGLTEYLLSLKWLDWDAEKIFRNMEALCSGDLGKIRNIKDI